MRDYQAMMRELAARRSAPAVWGSDANDCASYGNAVVRAETGRDVLRELGLEWGSEEEARGLLETRPIVARVSDVLPLISVSAARRGDLGAIEGPTGPCLVIVEGQIISGPGRSRARLLPRRLLTRAWSVE